MTRRVTVACALVALALFAWLVLSHPFGQGCVRQTGANSWTLVDAAGNNVQIAGRPPVAPVTCEQQP